MPNDRPPPARPKRPRSNGAEPPGAYAVGYGRPPAHSRFRPGQTGNPKGRPKGARSAAEMFQREAARLVNVELDDGVVALSKLEAVFRKLFELAESGDRRAISMVLAAHAHFEDKAPAREAAESAESSIPDDDAVRRMLARFRHLQAAAS